MPCLNGEELCSFLRELLFLRRLPLCLSKGWGRSGGKVGTSWFSSSHMWKQSPPSLCHPLTIHFSMPLQRKLSFSSHPEGDKCSDMVYSRHISPKRARLFPWVGEDLTGWKTEDPEDRRHGHCRGHYLINFTLFTDFDNCDVIILVNVLYSAHWRQWNFNCMWLSSPASPVQVLQGFVTASGIYEEVGKNGSDLRESHHVLVIWFMPCCHCSGPRREPNCMDRDHSLEWWRDSYESQRWDGTDLVGSW